MSVGSVLRDRAARWCAEITAYGYVLQEPTRQAELPGELLVRAVRPQTYGGPPAVVDVREIWVSGPDPDGLGLDQDGCHLLVGQWHAQITAGDVGAMRLDVDRGKPFTLAIHLHPYGQPNQVREPAAPLGSPEAWLERVETVIYTLADR
ncbi:MAG: hypothetical protein IT200_11195 [Thermoleophilia bacterium]|nr:hypothetical protein [Thermoleophilia bacterium]